MTVLSVALQVATENAPDVPWLGYIITLALGVLGTGGVSALLKVRADKRLGIAQQELAEDDAFAAQWKSIIETQTESLLNPLKARLSEVEAEVATLKAELETSRKKYWSAVSYIRSLLLWIGRNIPHDVEATLPQAPANLAEDI